MYNWQNNTSFITCKMVHVIKWLYYVNTCLFIQQDTCLNMDNRCHKKLLNDFCISSHTQEFFFFSHNHPLWLSYVKREVLIRFRLNPRNFNLRNFHFLSVFSFETLFPLSPSVMTLILKGVEFSCVSFGLSGKFACGC